MEQGLGIFLKLYQLLFLIILGCFTSSSLAKYSKFDIDCINYFSQKDYTMAFTACSNSYNKKPRYVSTVNLGVMYLLGRGANKDIGKALSLFREAVRLDGSDGTAEHNLGYALSEGIGVRKSQKQGFDWTLKAANLGHEGSQYNLAISYLDGEGVTRDDAKGYAWLKIASDSQSKHAISILSDVESQLDSATLLTSKSIYEELKSEMPISRIKRRQELIKEVNSLSNY